MIIVGEKLNSSIPLTLKALKENDVECLIKLIREQERCGADFLDINTSICGEDEQEKMLWLISLVKENSKCGIMIDSPSPSVIKEAVKACSGREIIINSVTLCDRIDELLPVAKESGAGLVCLPIDKEGIPETFEKRVENSKALIERVASFGIDLDKIYIDVLVEALSVGSHNARLVLNTIRELKRLYPGVKTIGGLSNISFGLPCRKYINNAFLAAAVEAGIDCCIMDIISADARATLAASKAIADQDEFCLEYIDFIRSMQ